MIKKIIQDRKRLSIPATEYANFEDIMNVVEDLIDTAKANQENCLGLTANQIGANTTIFVIKDKDEYRPIINPKVIYKKGGIKSHYETCLSFPGMRTKKRRHKCIKIEYIDDDLVEVDEEFIGLNARIVQHELDHIKGILI